MSPVDYDALAAKAGAVVDYDALAAKAGAISAPAAPNLTENTAGRGTYDMWDDKGQKQPIPYDKVTQAQQLGYNFDPNPTPTGLTPAQQFTRDQAADPARRGGTSFLMSAGMTPEEATERARMIEANAPLSMQVVGGIAKGGAELMRPVSDVFNLAAGVSPQQWSDEIAARGVAQHIAKYGTVGAALATAAPAAWANKMATGVSIGTGLLGTGAGQVIGSAAELSPAATQVLSDVGGLGAGAAGAEVLTPKVLPTVARFLPALVDGPPESLLTRAIKPGKNNVNWLTDVQKAGPLMKSAEQQLGRPIVGIDDALDAAANAKRAVWQQYQDRLGAAGQAGATIDGNRVADAMVNAIDKRTATQNPGLVARVSAVADTYRRPMPLNEAEDFLQSANKDLNSYYAKNKVGQNVALNDPEMASTVAEAGALRSGLYDKLDDLTGPGAAQIKQAYGALSNVQKELYGRQLVAARQQPESLAEQVSTARGVGQVIKGLATGSPGAALEGAANIAASRAIKARNLSDAMIERAFAKMQPAQPFPMPAQPTIAGLLPRGPIAMGATPASAVVPYQPPPYDATNRAQRLGLLLPQRAGGNILPYYPEMSEGEKVAALMQLLRSRPQLALPASAEPIQLPSSFSR